MGERPRDYQGSLETREDDAGNGGGTGESWCKQSSRGAMPQVDGGIAAGQGAVAGWDGMRGFWRCAADNGVSLAGRRRRSGYALRRLAA